MRQGPAPTKRSRGTVAKASTTRRSLSWATARSSSAYQWRACSRVGARAMSELSHLHLDRPFGSAVNELVDVSVVRLVDLAGRALPDQLALVQHGDAVTDLARARHVVGDRHCRGAKVADA